MQMVPRPVADHNAPTTEFVKAERGQKAEAELAEDRQGETREST